MTDSPLRDLRDAWREALQTLQAIHDRAEALYDASNRTWTDMILVQNKVFYAREALGRLPPGLLAGIATEEADFDEVEGRAYTGY